MPELTRSSFPQRLDAFLRRPDVSLMRPDIALKRSNSCQCRLETPDSIPVGIRCLFDFVRPAFSNLPMSKEGQSTKAEDRKVVDMDSGWKKEVTTIQETMKRVATNAELFALTQRVVLIEEHTRQIRDVLKITDDDDDDQ
ncbi:hypothetical protein CJ030_MR1G004456 [Morella rubra]|uniref:Uncharacterized protein n=1 Tax=Morella rubra TaxID=262757 RepID=A0A6A1WN03_9ROSI|nr:hypothetical protein CJ030_MR1G004456 [Morella rubra]